MVNVINLELSKRVCFQYNTDVFNKLLFALYFKQKMVLFGAYEEQWMRKCEVDSSRCLQLHKTLKNLEN